MWWRSPSPSSSLVLLSSTSMPRRSKVRTEGVRGLRRRRRGRAPCTASAPTRSPSAHTDTPAAIHLLHPRRQSRRTGRSAGAGRERRRRRSIYAAAVDLCSSVVL
ncbi:hypothetical protein HU200_060369 [Digitaria exilis]|uniref:Uncharacterized protein n=1 Tax=Digitaria exilis TaxID=1010633 RepID=A0A835E1R0_9POAL|nr:hypothetical protein HU200_060369 [Digitaria exilis]